MSRYVQFFKRMMYNQMLARVAMICVVVLFMVIPNAYAVSPEAPPGGLSFQAGANKVIGWMLFLIPIGGGLYCTYLWWTGMFGVEDRQKKADTKEHIQNVFKYAGYAWIGDAVVKAIFLALGISNGVVS